MNLQQRAATVESANGCARCTSWKHKRQDCKMKSNSCGYVNGSIVCQADHSKLLHGTTNVYCAAMNAHSSSENLFSCVKENEETVFYIQDIPTVGSKFKARTMWDKGCNRVLIRDFYAKKCNLISKEVVYMMETVGDVSPRQVKSNLYLLDLVDKYGNVHGIWGYGTHKIMSSSVPDLTQIRNLFPHVPDEAFKPLPVKEVDVLIGLNVNELQPAGGIGSDRVGGLSALRSLFGCGWVLGGHNENIRGSTSSEVSSAAATLKVAKILIEPRPALTPEFWEMDGMGVQPPPRCDNCRGCMQKGACSEKHFGYSMKKQAELDLIKQKTRLENGEIWCDYPFVRDPKCLSFNRDAAIKVAERVEKGLLKDNLKEKYDDQIKDQLRRNVAVKLSEE